MDTAKAHRLDAIAIFLSALCVVHCVAFPIIAVLLPFVSHIAELEIFHKALVVVTLPISTFAIAVTKPGRDRWVFAVIAGLGLSFLVAGAFVEAWHDYETILTVIGAVTIGAAHIFRWRCHIRHCSCAAH